MIFSDIYAWAGESRTVEISKPGSDFARVEHIDSYMNDLLLELSKENYLRNLKRRIFLSRLTFFFAEVNSVHPFREGNGRDQRAFFGQLTKEAGYRLAWERLNQNRNIEACWASHNLNNDLLNAMLNDLLEPNIG